MISTTQLKTKYKIPRQWLYDNSHKLKIQQIIVAGRIVNFYNEKEVLKLRKKHGC